MSSSKIVKPNLPKDWIVANSVNHPDRVYYFNVRTNKSSWEQPLPEETTMVPSKKTRSAKKQKTDTEDVDSSEPRPSPATSVSDKMNEMIPAERVKLCAKRKIPKSTDQTETPQMREIREKMLKKQSKSVAAKRTVANAYEGQDEPDKKVLKAEQLDAAKPTQSVASVDTPQMRALKEKICQRQMKVIVKKSVKNAITKKTVSSDKVSTATVQENDANVPKKRVSGLQRITETVREIVSPIIPSTPCIRRRGADKSKSFSEKVSSTSESKVISKGVTCKRLRKSLKHRGKSLASREVTSDTSSIDEVNRSLDISLARSSTPKTNVKTYKQNLATERMEKLVTSLNQSTQSRIESSLLDISSLSETNKSLDEANENLNSSLDKSLTPNTKIQLYKKNLAKERLQRFVESLKTQQKKEFHAVHKTAERVNQSPESIIQNHTLSEKESPPNIYKNAEVRLKSLHNRILMRESVANDNKSKSKEPVRDDKRQETRIPEKYDTTVESLIEEYNDVSSCEEMEWEPIEDEKIMDEVQSVRIQLCTNDTSIVMKELPENVLQFSDKFDKKSSQELYIVIDTNVFLSNLEAIEQARDAVFKSYGRPFIVVPWTVLRELDYIKDNRSMTKSPSLQAKARRAIRFLNLHFSAKHPRVKGQTPANVADNKDKFALECPDDEILQSCLQIREAGNSVVLLSYDKNLCNKAMVHDVVTLGRNDPLEKVDFLNASEGQSESSLRFHLQDNEDQPLNRVSSSNEELRVSSEMLDELKTVLKSFLSIIVAKEMENLFGEHWEKYTIIRPPWNLIDVLKCAVKHWMAAISESFLRRAESILKELLEVFNNLPDGGYVLKDVSNILERCNDLIQTVKIDKYPDLTVSTSRSIESLKKKCLENIKRIYEEKLRGKIGCENNVLEEERRAETAFQYFEEVYSYTRNLCGLAAESMGMPCSFSYVKPDPMPSIDDLKQAQPELAANLNRLLLALSAALEQVNDSHAGHVLVGLHQALLNFLPELSTKVSKDLTLLDLHCCLKKKETFLRAGLSQLQELSGYFCRMAGYNCT